MITGGKRKDPYIESVASRIHSKFKLKLIEYENYSGWSKIIFAGMVDQLFPVWDFSDPFVSHLFNEWEKHLDKHDIQLCSSGGNYTYMYFEKYYKVDETQFKRQITINNIHFEKNEWIALALLRGFDESGDKIFYHCRDRVIPERWAKKLIHLKPVYSYPTRSGLLSWKV